MDREKRIVWVDTAKGIGLLCVILGHLRVPLIATWVYTFHMPLFFFLSGVTYSGEKYTWKEFFCKKVKTLLIPYFSLGSVIFLFQAMLSIYNHEPRKVIWDMFRCFLVQEHYWTVWFLTCLFLTELMYYLLSKLSRGWFIIQTGLVAIMGVFGLCRYQLGWGSLPWNLDIALVALVFFHSGYGYRKYGKKQEGYGLIWVAKMGTSLIINIIAAVLCIKLAHESLDMSVGLYGNEPLTFLSAFAGISFVVLISKRISWKVFIYFGRNTMILFAWHSRIIIAMMQTIYVQMGWLQGSCFTDRLLYATITFVAILVILIPVNEMIKHSKLHSLFGV